jgi:type I restriction enzyme, R subunit
MHAPVERHDKIHFAAFFIAKDREAVIDGFLVDHEPPIQIRTELSAAGIVWEKGASVQVYVSTSHFYVT